MGRTERTEVVVEGKVAEGKVAKAVVAGKLLLAGTEEEVVAAD